MAAPTNLTATAIDDDSISLSWDAYTGATGYDIERDSVVIVSNHPTNSYTDTGLDPATSYDYRVRAKLGAAVAFNPQTDITWHSLFWAEGTAMQALAYADTGAVTSWPNETAEGDANTVVGSGGVYVASDPLFNGRPVVQFAAENGLSFTTSGALSQPFSYVIIAETGTKDQINKNVFQLGNAKWFLEGTATGATSLYYGGQASISVWPGINDSNGSGPYLHTGVWNGASSKNIANAGLSTGTGNMGTVTAGTAGKIAGVSSPVDLNIAFIGVVQGDITAHQNYPAFCQWVAEHYAVGVSTSEFMTGGAVSVPGDGYVYHTFTTSGTLTPIGDPVEVEYLVVAGGGGGGRTAGGGGGGGGLRSGAATIASAQTVTIGGGGAGSSTNNTGSSGTASSIGAISSAGGGGGAGDASGQRAGLTGGSGGGGRGFYAGAGGAGTADQGYDGGDGAGGVGVGEPAYGSGGGGGAGQVGADGTTATGGDGGDGAEWPTGSGTYYAGGGGGSAEPTYGYGAGGLGGGGTGSAGNNGTSTTGTANTGGGGGAGYTTDLGKAGGSGITIVRYPVDYAFTGVFDRFDRADGGLGAAWTTLTGSSALSIVSNQVVASTTAWREAYWNAQTFSGDQYAEIDAVGNASWTTANSVGIGLSQDAPGNNGYSFYWTGSGGYYIARWTGGGSTTIASVTGKGNTGTRRIRAQRVGSQLTMFVDGTQVLTVSDATHTSGYTTIFVNHALTKLDNFVAGAL